MPETTQSMVDTLNMVAKEPLSDDEQLEVNLWNKGRALGFVVNTQGWEVIREMLRSYVGQEVDRLLGTDPGDFEAVRSAHAVAFAAQRIYTIFIEDVKRAIDASRVTPKIVKDNLSKISPVPPESIG
jgi:hypothetical protein